VPLPSVVHWVRFRQGIRSKKDRPEPLKAADPKSGSRPLSCEAVVLSEACETL